MVLNLVPLKEHRERPAAAENENYNLRGSSCWISFKRQLQWPSEGKWGLVIFQQVCSRRLRCFGLGFLPVFPQVLSVTQCVKPGMPLAALHRMGFCLFFLLFLPWAQPCFCSAADWVAVPKVEC